MDNRSSPRPPRVRLAIAALALLAAPALEAQSPLRADVSRSTAASVAALPGPTMASARVAAHAERMPAAPALAAAPQISTEGKLLLFGGAVFLVGAIIGDDAGTVMMVGGGAIALYGLYRMMFRDGGVEAAATGS